jgi:hypothetical protein
MTRLEKFELINLVAIDLQSRFTFSELEAFLKEFKLNTVNYPKPNSKAVWVKDILGDSSDDVVTKIGNELNIKHKALNSSDPNAGNEATFWKPGHFKIFLSHLAKEKIRITRIKELLEPYGISGFVAHQDIEPTKEWEDEIIKALFSMNALVAVLQPGFRESAWTDQEMGIAMGRGILVIPLRAGLDPYGFVGKFQGIQIKGKNLSDVAEDIFKVLINNPKTKSDYVSLLIDLFLLSSSKNEGLNRVKVLNKISAFESTLISKLHSRTRDNIILKDANILTHLNNLFSTYGYSNITLDNFSNPVFTIYTDDDDLPF